MPKTSEDIFDDFKKWLYQTDSQKFIKYKNKRWYSEEEIMKALENHISKRHPAKMWIKGFKKELFGDD